MKKVKNGRQSSVITIILVGVSIGMLIALAGSALLAALISSERISENAMGPGGLAIIIISSYVSALAVKFRSDDKLVLMSIISGLVYFLILLSVTALFFEGKYTGVGVTGICIAAASLCASITRNKRSGRKVQRKRK